MGTSQNCHACRNGTGFEPAIRMAFQPIMDCETGRPYAYEALVRSADGASAASVLQQVDAENRYAFDQLCRVRAIEDACAAGLLETDARLSINFLPNAVYSPKACIRLTMATAKANGLPLDRLIFEFTENEELDVVHVQNIVASYRAFGFSCALDDFGAGYSGLGLLATFTPDLLKLDMHLVRTIDADPTRRAIINAMVALCRQLSIVLVAEGVETQAEADVLQLLGVRYLQGYYFAMPALGSLPLMPQRTEQRAIAHT